jgi:hypothetical protein
MIPFGSLSKYYSSNNNKMDKRNEFIVLSFYMISFAFVETSTRVYDHQLSSALSTIRTDDSSTDILQFLCFLKSQNWKERNQFAMSRLLEIESNSLDVLLSVCGPFQTSNFNSCAELHCLNWVHDAFDLNTVKRRKFPPKYTRISSEQMSRC